MSGGAKRPASEAVTHALTLRQPWATAITHHGKRLENRTRGPGKHLGARIALHAGAAKDQEAYYDLDVMGIAPAYGTQRPVRAVVGTARILAVLSDVVVTALGGFGYLLAADSTDGSALSVLTPEQVCTWAVGPVIWILGDVEAFRTPIPWSAGKLGIWAMPEELCARVAEARP